MRRRVFNRRIKRGSTRLRTYEKVNSDQNDPEGKQSQTHVGYLSTPLEGYNRHCQYDTGSRRWCRSSTTAFAT